VTIRNVPGFRKLFGNSSLAYLAIVLAIFGAGALVSILNWRNSIDRANAALVTGYQERLTQSKSIVTRSLNQYSLLLDDGTSLLTVTGDTLTQDQWLTFFQSYGLTKNYPGVRGVGYSTYMPATDSAPARVPVTYVGYISPSSAQAIGYDQLSDPVRSAAIKQAIQSNAVTMSGKVNLMLANNDPAFLIFKPIYDGPARNATERQASIKGFVYMNVDSTVFFNTLLARYIPPEVAVQIYDSSFSKDSLLYQTKNFDTEVKNIKNPIRSTLTITFGNRTWDFRIITAKGVLESDTSQSMTNLILGIGISALLATIVWYFTYYRERKIYWQKQIELQDAKDELLSLASHQLRTPATIVKQYLGILLQNYGGDITTQQRHLIQTAYDNNERQLEIANQFLEAARLGSGRIVLHTEPTSINKVLDAVIAEQRKIARGRRQKIVLTSPKQEYRVDGDPKYLPMVFENLINNALKYSKRSSTVTLSLHKAKSEVRVTVSDEGIGIAAEELPTLFEKFSHASNEQSASGNSTGIGLYLAQQIAQLHGGTITVESTLGKGSRFTVHLPLRHTISKGDS